MKKVLLPLLLLVFGIGSGVGAGLFLSPTPEVETVAVDSSCSDPDVEGSPQMATKKPAVVAPSDPEAPLNEFAKLNNQFLIPLVVEGEVGGLVVVSISLEVPTGGIERAFAAEPKIRDGFLQVMFDHANIGGFAGNFTSANNMRILREALLQSAKRSLGSGVIDVLISDIVRQDV